MEISTDKKAFLIGAGFDKMFGMPTWNELIILFKDFLVFNSKYDFLKLKNELNFIYNQKYNSTRTFGMLLNCAIDYGFDELDFKKFFKFFLNIHKYNHNKDLLRSIFKEMSKSNDYFITTNFSNTFDSFGWKPIWIHQESIIKTYLPIHGNVFQDNINVELFNIIISEKDYLEQSYANRMSRLTDFIESNDIKEMHIYGYSINDVDIFKEIMHSSIKKIYIYIGYEKVQWRDLQKKYFTKLFESFGKKSYFIVPEDDEPSKWTKTDEELSNYLTKIGEKKNKLNAYGILLNKMKNNCLKSNTIMDISDWGESDD